MPAIFEIMFGGRRTGGRRARGQTYDCLFLLFQMRSISIEKQRTCPPFLKLCLEDGWAGRPAGAGARLARGNTFSNYSKAKEIP